MVIGIQFNTQEKKEEGLLTSDRWAIEKRKEKRRGIDRASGFAKINFWRVRWLTVKTQNTCNCEIFFPKPAIFFFGKSQMGQPFKQKPIKNGPVLAGHLVQLVVI